MLSEEEIIKCLEESVNPDRKIKIDRNTNLFEHPDLDSLEGLEAIMDLEDEHDINIPTENEDLYIVGNLIDYVQKQYPDYNP
jgi:acyl carrier protein